MKVRILNDHRIHQLALYQQETLDRMSSSGTKGEGLSHKQPSSTKKGTGCKGRKEMCFLVMHKSI